MSIAGLRQSVPRDHDLFSDFAEILVPLSQSRDLSVDQKKVMIRKFLEVWVITSDRRRSRSASVDYMRVCVPFIDHPDPPELREG